MPKGTEHRWAVDSIAEGVARVEEDGKEMLSIPASLLPRGVTEGQLLRVTREAGSEQGSIVLTIAVDVESTTAALAKSKATMADAMKASSKRDPGGDVAL